MGVREFNQRALFRLPVDWIQKCSKNAEKQEKIFNHQLPAAFARTHLESLSALDIDSNPGPHRLTNIVCTIGPASKSEEVLLHMMEAGMCIARMNFSHGTYEYHGEVFRLVQETANKFGKPLAIALDTKGPEIRTGMMKAGPGTDVELVKGSTVTVTTDDTYKEMCDDKMIYMDYKNLPDVMEVGKKIFIDDGNMSLIVKSKGPQKLECEVEFGGKLSSQKGVNLPKTVTDLPAVSEKDIEDIKFGVELGVDFIFASFIRSGEGVKSIRSILGDQGKHIKIISKIETHDGVRRFNEILQASDGVMVARGDLGTEIPTEKVFLAQKMIIARCNRVGKPVICATQMLESMTKNSRPTRAEAGDVANAVIDGADCVMLSGESAKGEYPVVCVETMHRICLEAEAAVYHKQLFEELRMLTPRPADVTRCTSIAAVEASVSCLAGAIIALTTTGRSAACISSYRPRCVIIAVTREAQTARGLRIHRGVFPVIYKEPKAPTWDKDLENRLLHGLRVAEGLGCVKNNQIVVFVYGAHSGPGNTNTIRIVQYTKK